MNDHEPLYPVVDSHSKPFRLNFSISEVTGAPTELLPRLSPSSHQPFLLAYCFPVSLLTVLRPPRCSFNRSKKRFLGAVLIVFTIFCFLPIESCQLEV